MLMPISPQLGEINGTNHENVGNIADQGNGSPGIVGISAIFMPEPI